MGFGAKNVLFALNARFPDSFELLAEQSRGFTLAAQGGISNSGQKVVPDGKTAFEFLRLPRSADEERLPAPDIECRISGDRQTVRIWEDQWQFRRSAVISRIAARLGRCSRIHGRETVVRRVDSADGLQFLEAHHLLVPLKGKYRFGLFHREELCSLAVFSGARQMKSRGENYRSFELLRFCHGHRLLVSGGLSKLLSAFAAAFQPDDIMTYVDLDWPGGEAFMKSDFIPAGNLPPQVFWINPREGIRYYPGRLPLALRDTDPGRMHEQGYFRISNSGSLKLIRRFTPE